MEWAKLPQYPCISRGENGKFVAKSHSKNEEAKVISSTNNTNLLQRRTTLLRDLKNHKDIEELCRITRDIEMYAQKTKAKKEKHEGKADGKADGKAVHRHIQNHKESLEKYPATKQHQREQNHYFNVFNVIDEDMIVKIS